MNEARKFAKGRKPEKCIWSQRRRPALVRRKDVMPEVWEAIPVWHKYPKRLLHEVNKAPCLTQMMRAAERQRNFVGPPKPERKQSDYPLTNWKRKRLDNSWMYRYARNRFLLRKGYAAVDVRQPNPFSLTLFTP